MNPKDDTAIIFGNFSRHNDLSKSSSNAQPIYGNTCLGMNLIHKAESTTYLLESLNCYDDFELTMVYNKMFNCNIDCVTDENIKCMETAFNLPVYIPICDVKTYFETAQNKMIGYLQYTRHDILKHLLDREINK